MNTKIGKISFLAVGLILVVAFSAFLVNKNLHDPKLFGPVITFSVDKFDFGDVKQGPVLEGTYEFKNTGQQVLEIKSVAPSCGCTGVVADEKKEFQPGETGKVKFTFNTEGRTGVNEKTINVASNDPKTPAKVLTFKCNIQQ